LWEFDDLVVTLSKQGLLAGRVALVTGAARGLGFAIAQTLAREGAHLVISDLDGRGLEIAASELEESGYSVRTVTGNVASVSDGVAMVGSALKGYGRLVRRSREQCRRKR
jgi:NAD(P)-dependent dehydrogenase (short-subunit alcohol dehydrogenase family)